jgi:hypothetical protein
VPTNPTARGRTLRGHTPCGTRASGPAPMPSLAASSRVLRIRGVAETEVNVHFAVVEAVDDSEAID